MMATKVLALENLERAVRAMFAYSGWDDCDADAAKCVHEVEQALRALDGLKVLQDAMRRASSASSAKASTP